MEKPDRRTRWRIDYAPVRESLAEMGVGALDVAQVTGIALPKVLRLMGVVSTNRVSDELSGIELVRLCAFTGLPLSAVVIEAR